MLNGLFKLITGFGLLGLRGGGGDDGGGGEGVPGLAKDPELSQVLDIQREYGARQVPPSEALRGGQGALINMLLGQAQQIAPAQTQFITQELERAGRLGGLQEQFLQQQLPQATQLAQQRGALLGNIFTGQALPGRLGILGTGFSPETIRELVSTGVEERLPQLEQLGLLESGQTLSDIASIGEDIAFQSEMQKRSELANLLGMGLGAGQQAIGTPFDVSQQLTGQALAAAPGMIGQALSAAPGFVQQPFEVLGQAQQGLLGREQLQNQMAMQAYQLQLQADMAARQARATQMGGLFGGIGRLAGGIAGGMLADRVGASVGASLGGGLGKTGTATLV